MAREGGSRVGTWGQPRGAEEDATRGLCGGRVLHVGGGGPGAPLSGL